MRIDVPGWDAPMYIDVAICFPQPGSPGKAAADKEGEKEAAYPVWAARVRQQAVDFSPCVLESLGRFGIRSAALVGRLAGENAAAWGLHPAKIAGAKSPSGAYRTIEVMVEDRLW